MLIVFALVGVLLLGLIGGLTWCGVVLIGDRRALDRLSAQLRTEQRMAMTTHATLQAMRQVVRGDGP